MIVTALTSTVVDPAERLKICEACTLVDSKGELLFRTGPGNARLCGRLLSIRDQIQGRDEKAEGCGCILDLKARMSDGHCPNCFW